jgi:hypothetical protein
MPTQLASADGGALFFRGLGKPTHFLGGGAQHLVGGGRILRPSQQSSRKPILRDRAGRGIDVLTGDAHSGTGHESMPLDVILSFNADSSDFDLLILCKVFHQSDRSRSIPSSLRLKHDDDSLRVV